MKILQPSAGVRYVSDTRSAQSNIISAICSILGIPCSSSVFDILKKLCLSNGGVTLNFSKTALDPIYNIVKKHEFIYYNCHENPCRWGYQFCDIVIRRCVACDVVSNTCHTPRQLFNCTLHCDEITRSGETLTTASCDDVHHLLYVLTGTNVLFAFFLVLVVCLLRSEIKAAVVSLIGKLLYTKRGPDCRLQDGPSVETNASGAVFLFQRTVRNTEALGGIARNEHREKISRFNEVPYQQQEYAGSQRQQESEQPNIHEQNCVSAADDVRGELQSRLSVGVSFRHAYSPPGRHIPPASADTGYNSGNGKKDPL